MNTLSAETIRRLMRQGVRCGKIAVVCRDIAKYRAAVRYEFRMADIPLYCDEPTTPEFSAPATAVTAMKAKNRNAPKRRANALPNGSSHNPQNRLATRRPWP